MGIDYTQLSANLEGNIDEVGMKWEDVVWTTPVSKWRIERSRTSYTGPSPITVHPLRTEEAILYKNSHHCNYTIPRLKQLFLRKLPSWIRWCSGTGATTHLARTTGELPSAFSQFPRTTRRKSPHSRTRNPHKCIAKIRKKKFSNFDKNWNDPSTHPCTAI